MWDSSKSHEKWRKTIKNPLFGTPKTLSGGWFTRECFHFLNGSLPGYRESDPIRGQKWPLKHQKHDSQNHFFLPKSYTTKEKKWPRAPPFWGGYPTLFFNSSSLFIKTNPLWGCTSHTLSGVLPLCCLFFCIKPMVFPLRTNKYHSNICTAQWWCKLLPILDDS